MLELGNFSKRLHLEVGKEINKTSLKNINVVGKHILYTYKNLDKHRRGVTLKDKSKIIDLIKNDLNNNDYLMIKGSNSTGLNNLVNKLKTGVSIMMFKNYIMDLHMMIETPVSSCRT